MTARDLSALSDDALMGALRAGASESVLLEGADILTSADPIPAGVSDGARALVAGRVFTIDIPPRTELLNLNRRPHYFKEARIAKNLRLVAFQLAKYRRIPRLDRAVITGYLHVPDNRRRDPANWQLTLKHCIDGVVDAGVLADDSAQYVTDGGVRLGAKTRYLSFSFEIRELP